MKNVGRLAAWAIFVLFVVPGLVSLFNHQPLVGAAALIVALAAFPPLWSSDVLRNAPFAARAALGIFGFVLLMLSVPKPANQPQPAAPTATTAAKPETPSAPPPAASDTPPAAEAAPANWSYDETFDAMRNKSTYFACVKSDNELEFRFPYDGGVHGTLCFRNSSQFGTDVYLTMEKGQFTCSFEGCAVHLKFDGGRILSFGASEATGGNANVLFIHGYSKLKQLMRNGKHLILEAEFYEDGMEQLQFTISGFDWKH